MGRPTEAEEECVADRVVLHIGTMKSGTTYLQSALMSGAAALEAAGAWYAGGSFKTQTDALAGMLGSPDPAAKPEWRSLVAEIEGRDGVALISQEFLSFARRREIDALVGSFEGTEVDVVLTVRDQHRAIPAQWQSYTRNLGTDDWATYLRRLEPMRSDRRGGSLALRKFRRAQDVPAIVSRWTAHVGVTRLVVVTVPPSGAEPVALWRRFCEASRLEAADPPASGAPANESLGYASCDLLRRLNVYITALPKPRYRRARLEVVRALLPLRADEGRPELDRDGAALARLLNGRVRDCVAAHPRVSLVGSLDDLPVDASRSAADTVPPPDPRELRRAAEQAWRVCRPDEQPPPADLDALVSELGEALVARH
jgi:hypothetical protein